MSTVFDRIATSRPVNRAAAIVGGGSGTAFVPIKAIPAHHVHTHAPLPTVPFTVEGHDLTGTRCGLFTVTGRYAENPQRTKPGRWVMRCVCGQYELRNTSAIKRLVRAIPGDVGDRCADCEKTRTLRQRASRGRR